MSELLDIFNRNFIQPMYSEQSYTFLNTIVYALIAFTGLYLIYKVIGGKIKFDKKFFYATVPFVFLGSALRSFVDVGYIARTPWLVSPGIYAIITTLFLVVLTISLALKAKLKLSYWKITAITGLVLLIGSFIYVANKIQLEHMNLASSILVLMAFVSFLIYYIVKSKIFAPLAAIAIFAHVFDAFNTSMILRFVGGWEKHPLPRYFIERFGAFSFIPLKLLVVIPAVWLISTDDNKQFSNLLLITVAVLGLAEGLRNFITLILV